MDLPYPTQNNVEAISQLHRLDQKTYQITNSIREVQHQDIIPKHKKQKILKLIAKDQPIQLISYLSKNVITFHSEIGPLLSRWNILHFSAKYNASKCLSLMLAKIYQQQPQQFLNLLNLQTIEGYTILMVSIINFADQTLSLLLNCGGSDLYVLSVDKMRAYDLALNHQNELAINLLVVYEQKCKKKMFINSQLLKLNASHQIQPTTNSCANFFQSVINCLLCISTDEQEQKQSSKPFINKISKHIRSFQQKPIDLVPHIDFVQIGTKKLIESYEIQWKRLSQIKQQKYILFDSFKPLNISENNYSLKQNLIIFQTLSTFSWILKKAIAKSEQQKGKKQEVNLESNKFVVNLYKNYSHVKITVDDYVPYLKEREEGMFLSNNNEIWPMILQKALAKTYGSYLELDNINTKEFIQDITGFYTTSIAVQEWSQFSSKGVIHKLQQYTSMGYFIVLQGRQGTDLTKSSNAANTFSILNYYEKGNHKKILINCSFVVEEWKKKQQKEIIALKAIKAHFNKHNQMCVWIDESEFNFYFKNIIISFIRENLIRTELKITFQSKPSHKKPQPHNKSQPKKLIFLKLKIESKRDDSLYLELVDLQNKFEYNLQLLDGYKNEGESSLNLEEPDKFCERIAKIPCDVGQYICMFQITCKKQYEHNEAKEIIISQKGGIPTNKSIILKDKKEKDYIPQDKKKRVKLNIHQDHPKELMLITWSVDAIHPEFLEEQFGEVEWLSYYRNYSIRNWNQLINEIIQSNFEPQPSEIIKRKQCYVYETVGNKTLILLKKNEVKSAFLRIKLEDETFGSDQMDQDNIIEGRMSKNQEYIVIEFIKQAEHKNFYYIVVSNFAISDLERGGRIDFLFESIE